MRFTVVWRPSADADLASLWTDNEQLRAEINAAPGRIDAELRIDAHTKGVAIDNYRTLRVSPFVVLYSVEMGDMAVRVVHLSLADTES